MTKRIGWFALILVGVCGLLGLPRLQAQQSALTIHATPAARGARHGTAVLAKLAGKAQWSGNYVRVGRAVPSALLARLWTPWPRWWADWTDDGDGSMPPQARFFNAYEGRVLVSLAGPKRKSHTRCVFAPPTAGQDGTAASRGRCQLRRSGREFRAALVVDRVR